jgi:hypothetical protein
VMLEMWMSVEMDQKGKLISLILERSGGRALIRGRPSRG